MGTGALVLAGLGGLAPWPHMKHALNMANLLAGNTEFRHNA